MIEKLLKTAWVKPVSTGRNAWQVWIPLVSPEGAQAGLYIGFPQEGKFCITDGGSTFFNVRRMFPYDLKPEMYKVINNPNYEARVVDGGSIEAEGGLTEKEIAQIQDRFDAELVYLRVDMESTQDAERKAEIQARIDELKEDKENALLAAMGPAFSVAFWDVIRLIVKMQEIAE